MPEATGRWIRFTAIPFREVLIRNSMVGVLVLVAVYFSLVNSRFASPENALAILIAAAPFALIAMGQTMVILTAGIDLSVGSVISLSAMAAAWCAKANPDNLWYAFIVALAVGATVGAVNGVLVAVFQITPFVATLATMTVGSGLAFAVGNGAPISGITADYGFLANTKWLGLPVPVWVMIAGFIVFAVLLRRFAYGTKVYAIGGNPHAAEIAGIKVNRVLFTVYLTSGTLAGISGAFISSRVVSATPTMGLGYELDAIAAVVIGGASLFGGRGTIWGTALGLLLIQTLNNGLDIILVPSYWQDVIMGGLIAAAVGLDVYATRRLGRR